MRLYEYLIGGKKTGQIEDLKDPIPDSKPFRELKTGEAFFMFKFNPDGTCFYVDKIKITSIDKEHTHWVFTGFGKGGVRYTYSVWMKDLNKKLVAWGVWNQHTHYKVYSTFKMDAVPLFELIKKEIKN